MSCYNIRPHCPLPPEKSRWKLVSPHGPSGRDVAQKAPVRFQVLAAAGMKVTSFWDVAPCSLTLKYTDVSEVFTASIIRAMNEDLNPLNKI
jgi:hypothetical protein